MATSPKAKPTLIEQTVEQWTKRLNELQPVVDEYNEIQAVLRAVQKPASTGGGGGTGRRGRPRGSGTRAQEFLALVQKNPGITIAEAGPKMNVAPNYLYRVAAGLTEDGKITKEDTGYHPVAAAAGKSDKS